MFLHLFEVLFLCFVVSFVTCFARLCCIRSDLNLNGLWRHIPGIFAQQLLCSLLSREASQGTGNCFLLYIVVTPIYTALVPWSNFAKNLPQHELKSWSNSDYWYVLDVQWHTCFFKLFFVFWHNQHWSEPISDTIVADTCRFPGLKSGILNGAC